MYGKKHLNLIFCLTVIGFTGLTAQQQLRFKHLNLEQGLSHSLVTDVIQDRRGFIWVGTQDGLNRFDGYHFRIFRPDPKLKNSPHGKWISELFEDSSGQIWIRYRSGGLDRYDPVHQQFHHYLHDPADPHSISDDLATEFRFLKTMSQTILEDRNGAIWIGTANGLNRYNRLTNDFTRYYHNPENPKSLPDNTIMTLLQDDHGFVWVGTKEGLARFDPVTGKCLRFQHDPENPLQSLSNNYVRTLLQDSRGNIWVGTRFGGVNRFSCDTGTGEYRIEQYLYAPSTPAHARTDGIYGLLETRRGEIWVGAETGVFFLKPGEKKFTPLPVTQPVSKAQYLLEDSKGYVWIGGVQIEFGLLRVPPDRSRVEYYEHSDVLSFSLSNNAIAGLMEDRTGVLWIATVKGGINLIDNNRKQFRHYYRDPSNPNSLNDNDVYAIYEDGKETLWVGTKSGLNRIDRQTGSVEIYEKQADNENSPSGQIVGVIEPDPGGFLWLGYFDYKISKFHPAKEQFTHFHHHELDPESYLAWSVRDILIDRNGQTWFGASTHALTQLKKDGHSFRYFPNESPIPLPSNKYSINCLHQDRNGYLWVGHFDSGLSRFDPQHHSFKNYKHHPADPNSLSSNEVKCILEEEDGAFWIGTGAGLNHFDPKTEIFRHYTTNDGLPNNTILGILKDRHGRLWLSTNGGLSCFNPKTETFDNYYAENGLQSNEFNEGAYFKSREGEFFFGGVNGVTAFFPDSIRLNPFLPEVAITQLRIFNQPVHPGDTIGEKVILSRAIEYTQELELSYRESVFSFEFTALHFAAASKNRFAYKMEGFDNAWTYIDADQRYATYTNLDPGAYTFRVKATNNDGRWNESGDFIHIRILPPWWNTPIFRRSLFLFLFLASIGVIRLRILRLKAQKAHLEHLVRQRTGALSRANTELDESRQAVLAQKDQIEVQKQHLEQQNRNIRLLSEIGQNITSTIKIEEIMAKIYESLNALMDAPNFSIGQINPSRNVIDFFAFETPEKPLSKLEIPLSDQHHLSVWAIHNGETIFMNELEYEIGAYFEDVPERYDAGTPYQSAIYLPLRAASEKVIGILIVKSPKAKAYSPFHLQVLKNLAAYIAIAIDNAQAYREIEEQSEQLRNMDELKTRFYTNISHEFRTPLTLILGSVANLQKGPNLSPVQKRSLQMLERNARRLLRLVTQIMDLSKLEGGVLHLEVSRENIVRHLRLIIDSFDHLAQQKGVSFSFYAKEEIVEGLVDKDKLEKIVYNLLFNAFKFTPRGGKVAVYFRTLQPDGASRHLEIEVKDTGTGIPEKDLKNVFQRFYQVRDRADRKSDGAGIGLSLVHHLVELHYGAIQVESQVDGPGQGTSFRVQIPIDRTAYQPEEIRQNLTPQKARTLSTLNAAYVNYPARDAELPPPPYRERPTVLVVEDDDDMRTFIKQCLRDEFEIVEAAHGKTGIALAGRHHPDLILTDVMMPCYNGFELCQQLKKDPATSHIPIIILTAKTSSDAELEGLQAGADDYLTKPFRTDALRYKLQNIISTRRQLIEQYKNDLWMKEEQLTTSASDKALLQKAVAIIDQHLSDPKLDVALFTREMAVGRTVLYEKIKSITGLSINELIKTHRLKTAARMMLEQNSSISELSYQVGFNDPKYFSKCFKKQFGQSPRAYINSFAEK